MTVRSYRRVFRVDHRIYRIDRWQIPVPGGIPLRGLALWLLVMVVLFVVGQTPLGLLFDLPGTFVHWVVLPIALTVLLSQVTPDGRSMHGYLVSRVVLAAQPKDRDIALKGSVRMRWDVDAPELRRARITGPARVSANVPVALSAARRRLVIRRAEDSACAGREEGCVVVTCPGSTLEIKP